MKNNNTAATPEVPASVLAHAAGVSLRTARRWKASGRMPAPLAAVIPLAVAGDLGAVSVSWRGWRLAFGELVSPEGWRFRPGDVLAGPIRDEQLRELQRRAGEPRQLRF